MQNDGYKEDLSFFQQAHFDYDEQPYSDASTQPYQSSHGPKSVDLNQYDCRFRTLCDLQDFSISKETAEGLAKFGMVYMVDGITKCFSCRKVHNNWKNEENIYEATLHEEDCQFFEEFRASNEKLGAEPFWFEEVGTQCSLPRRSMHTRTSMTAEPSCMHAVAHGMQIIRGIVQGIPWLQCLSWYVNARADDDDDPTDAPAIPDKVPLVRDQGMGTDE